MIQGMLGINFLSFQHWKQIQGQHTIKILNQTPTGWPMGVPGSRGALGRSPKNLMIQGMLGINFLSFQHWKWIQGQHTIKRSIFQTFWKKHSCAKFLSFELETSNFGSSYVFSSPSKWGGRFLPNLTFWTPKRHISGKCRYHYSKICVSWDKCMKFWLQPWFWEPVKIGGSDFTQLDVKNSKTAYFRYNPR